VAVLAGSSNIRADEQRGDRRSQRASEHVPALQTPRDKIAKTRGFQSQSMAAHHRRRRK
jgi:hypothetical protein